MQDFSRNTEGAWSRGLEGSEDVRPLIPIKALDRAADLQVLQPEEVSSPANGRFKLQRSWTHWLHEEAVAACSVLGLTFACFVYNAVFLKEVLPTLGKQEMVRPAGIAFNTLWVLTMWSYLNAHLRSPGTVPRRWREFVDAVGDSMYVAPPRREWQPGQASFCRACMVLRPERTHHCSICDICVLRYDHHCPFVKNCIGFRNHKFFILLLVYGMFLSWCGLVTTLPEMTSFIAAFLRLYRGEPWPHQHISMLNAGLVLAFDVVAMVFATLFPPMAFMHLPLATRNVTTIETVYRNMPNPYNTGNCCTNLSQIFGRPGLDWLLPIGPCRPSGDGLSFDRVDLNLPELELEMDRIEGDVEKLWQLRYGIGDLGMNMAHKQRSGPTCVGCFH